MGYQLIETIEVGSGGASAINITGISQDFIDLKFVVSARSSTASNLNRLFFRFNNDTSTGLVTNWRSLEGTGSAVQSRAQTSGDSEVTLWQILPGSTSTANTFCNVGIYVSNYTSTGTKAFSVDAVSEQNASEAWQVLLAGSYSGSSAIDEINFFSGNFVENTTVSVYGITVD